MKVKIMNIIHTVWTFIKAHTVASIVVGAVVVTAAVATPVTIHLINEHKQPAFEPHNESSITSPDDKYVQQAEQEEEEAAPKTEDETVNEEEKQAQVEAENNDKKDEAVKEESSSQPNNTEPPKNENTTSNQSAVVQTANTSTGISWDGKSPIVYTYADGTTGTTPQEGASYEILPGVYGTYTAPNGTAEQPYDGTCEFCGRKGGDGANGTCLRFWGGGDHTCEHCGAVVPVNICHTCG